jgi:hypothetical protein
VTRLGFESGWWETLDAVALIIDEERSASARIDGAGSVEMSVTDFTGASLVTAAGVHLAQRRLLRTEDHVRATAGALLVTMEVVGVASASTEREFLALLSLRVVSPSGEIRPAHSGLDGQVADVDYNLLEEIINLSVLNLWPSV